MILRDVEDVIVIFRGGTGLGFSYTLKFVFDILK